MTGVWLVSLSNHRPFDKLRDRRKSVGSGVLRHRCLSFRGCSGEIDVHRHGTMGGGVCMSGRCPVTPGMTARVPGMTVRVPDMKGDEPMASLGRS